VRARPSPHLTPGPPAPDRLARIPKVELHRHLEGSMRSDTVRDLARHHGIAFPVDDPEELYRYRDLADFLDVYALVCSLLIEADDFRRLTYESIEDAHHAGVRYAELFCSPWFHLVRGVAFATMWDGMRRGMLDAAHDFGLQTRLIADIDKPAGLAHAMTLVELAAACDRDLLIGIGGDNLEAGVDHRALAPAFALAAKCGLHRTIHAGEHTVDTVRAAVYDLGCERVDHGVLVVDDPELLAEVVDRRISFTVCPTSDIEVSKVWPTLGEHSFGEMRAAGVRLTLNSDDPTMLRNEIHEEYAKVAAAFALSYEDCIDIAVGGIESTWLDDGDKRALQARFAQEVETLRRELTA
jgi:adenosine deaminase